MGITKYIKFYNEKRTHSSLNYKTPAKVFDLQNI
jgi:transposase InsO family protein